MWGLTKDRHDRVLYVLARTVLQAAGGPLPPAYRALGGVAKPGVFDFGTTIMKVDQVNPTDREVTESRPDLLVRQTVEKRIVILEVACSWESLITEREREKAAKYQELAADLFQQYEGYRVVVAPVVMSDLGAIGNAGRELAGTQLFNKSVVGSLIASMQRETICGSMRLVARHLALLWLHCAPQKEHNGAGPDSRIESEEVLNSIVLNSIVLTNSIVLKY